MVTFVPDEAVEPMEQRFSGKTDVREDEVIQSAIVKIIERSEVKTVKLVEGLSIKV